MILQAGVQRVGISLDGLSRARFGARASKASKASWGKKHGKPAAD